MEKKLGYIDALRGLAVLGVLMVHVGMHSLKGHSQNIIGIGAKGVQLFYFVSAFTLFLSSNLRRKKEDNPNLNFCIRRVFRIAPMYYLAIGYYAIFVVYFTSSQSINWGGIFSNMAFVHSFFPFYINSVVPGGWSIAIEMLFYLFVPLMIIKISSLNKSLFFLVICMFIKAVFNGLLISNPFKFPDQLWSNYMYWYLPSQLPVFAFGIIFYFLVSTPNIPGYLSHNRKKVLLAVFLLLLLFVGDKLKFKASIFNVDFFLGFTFVFFAYFLSVRNIKALVNRVTEFIGKLSFSMYLNHFAAIYWLSRFKIIDVDTVQNEVHFIYNYLCVLGVTTILSYITYSLIELKGQKLGKALIQKIEQKAKI